MCDVWGFIARLGSFKTVDCFSSMPSSEKKNYSHFQHYRRFELCLTKTVVIGYVTACCEN